MLLLPGYLLRRSGLRSGLCSGSGLRPRLRSGSGSRLRPGLRSRLRSRLLPLPADLLQTVLQTVLPADLLQTVLQTVLPSPLLPGLRSRLCASV